MYPKIRKKGTKTVNVFQSNETLNNVRKKKRKKLILKYKHVYKHTPDFKHDQ